MHKDIKNINKGTTNKKKGLPFVGDIFISK